MTRLGWYLTLRVCRAHDTCIASTLERPALMGIAECRNTLLGTEIIERTQALFVDWIITEQWEIPQRGMSAELMLGLGSPFLTTHHIFTPWSIFRHTPTSCSQRITN